MNTKEAFLLLINENKKIRKKNWPKGCYLFYNKELDDIDLSNLCFLLNSFYKCSNEWEVYNDEENNEELSKDFDELINISKKILKDFKNIFSKRGNYE